MKYFLILLPAWAYQIEYSTTAVPLENWMSYFADIYVADLPMIPGSHDSGTQAVLPTEDWLGIAGWLYAQTQTLSIRDQLDAGIRLLDIRVWIAYDLFDQYNSIYVSHTFRSTYTLTAALDEVAEFLIANPTEFVYLNLRIDAAHPLTEDITEQKEYLESMVLSSAITLGEVVGADLLNLKVKDVAGKVLLICPPGKVLPTDTQILYLASPAEYDLCDIFQDSSQYLAKETISECFPSTPVSPRLTGQITGFALDGQFDQVWPAITSPEMNEWFIYNFQSNPDWEARTKYPIGVFLFDFVDTEYTAILVQYIMNFGYPYPYLGEKPEWTMGMAITTKSVENIYLPIIFFIINML